MALRHERDVFPSVLPNANSLGIELCARKQGEKYYFTPETVKNAAEFCRFLMKKYDIPLANVVRHYDVTHKNCPAPFVEDAAAWQSFKAGLIQLTKEKNMTEKQVKQLVAQAKTVYDTAESVPEWGKGTVDKLAFGRSSARHRREARPQRGNAARACCARSTGAFDR